MFSDYDFEDALDAIGPFILPVLFGLVWLYFVCSGSCDIPKQDAVRLLKQEGISDVRLGGYTSFLCGRDDSFNSSFEGIKNGVVVKGVICAGWSKGYTIRYQ